jgi:predicted PolB exonuclease-like 3'-5' exonuclease
MSMLTPPFLCFDIETIPDAYGLRQLLMADTAHPHHAEIAQWDDRQVVEYALAQRREKTNGSDFLPLHQHCVVAISCLFCDGHSLKVATFGGEAHEESKTIQSFYRSMDKYTPQLISWNGGGFDLPVLNYRALIHGLQAPTFWDVGDMQLTHSREMKWNNYLSRYHYRHLDLMDLLALYQPRASAPLDDLAKLCGFPGKMGMDGSKVWQAYCDGQLTDIKNYCETDVMNTWLVFVRFMQLKGSINRSEYDAYIEMAQTFLHAHQHATHWQTYLDAWLAAPTRS